MAETLVDFTYRGRRYEVPIDLPEGRSLDEARTALMASAEESPENFELAAGLAPSGPTMPLPKGLAAPTLESEAERLSPSFRKPLIDQLGIPTPARVAETLPVLGGLLGGSVAGPGALATMALTGGGTGLGSILSDLVQGNKPDVVKAGAEGIISGGLAGTGASVGKLIKAVKTAKANRGLYEAAKTKAIKEGVSITNLENALDESKGAFQELLSKAKADATVAQRQRIVNATDLVRTNAEQIEMLAQKYGTVKELSRARSVADKARDAKAVSEIDKKINSLRDLEMKQIRLKGQLSDAKAAAPEVPSYKDTMTNDLLDKLRAAKDSRALSAAEAELLKLREGPDIVKISGAGAGALGSLAGAGSSAYWLSRLLTGGKR